MTILNTTLWALGLVLQALLLMGLVRRGGAGRLPAFTALVAFYLLRSVLLFTLYGRLSPGAYSSSVGVLSALDLLFQFAVAWELLAYNLISPASPGRHLSPLRCLTLGSVLAILAAGLTWVVSHALPAMPRAPIDRGVLVISALMVLVGAVCLPRVAAAPRLPRRVLLGFAIVGAAGIVSQCGKAVSAMHRDVAAFTGWSYAEPLIYLLVLLLWNEAVWQGVVEAGAVHASG